MQLPRVYLWQQAPFTRLLLPFVIGIIVAYYTALPRIASAILLLLGLVFILLYQWFSIKSRFVLVVLPGLAIHLALFGAGALLCYRTDIRNHHQWIGRFPDGAYLIVRTIEPPQEKAASYKVLAEVIRCENEVSKGKIIIYFSKDSTDQIPVYGSYLLIKRPPVTIRNSGNPGSFDYRPYCLHQGITHQVFLRKGEWQQLHERKTFMLANLIYWCRVKVLETLTRYIPGAKERGLAEALLIGYRDDLDRELVQAYSNTGVVHVIAISGLHLGLIYALLMMLTTSLEARARWLRLILVLTALWLFTLLASAQPSVLRSAFMFSTMAIGKAISRRSHSFNSLAASAFILLCINPFTLWDIGFQLSYAAISSILLFYRPLVNLFYFPNKLVLHFWQLNAVTLAAQLITTPVCLYHFHQFPNLFILANLVAVPLSSLILLGEILLFALLPLTTIASLLGKLLAIAINWMNTYIERLDAIAFAAWTGIEISMLQCFLLLAMVATIYMLPRLKVKTSLYLFLLLLLFFGILRSYSFYRAEKQEWLIVYDAGKYRAAAIIHGRAQYFVGDNDLFKDRAAMRFHLQPTLSALRIKNVMVADQGIYNCNGKKIVFASAPFADTISADFLVLDHKEAPLPGKNPGAKKLTIIYGKRLPAWKQKKWNEWSNQNGMKQYSVRDSGAYIIKL